MRFGHYTVFDTPEENKHTQVYVEYDVPNKDNLDGATGAIFLTEGGEGSGVGIKHGIESVTILPAGNDTNPPMAEVFPIYWEDLTPEQRAYMNDDGWPITVQPGNIDPSDEYSIVIKPTANMYLWDDAISGYRGAGESVTQYLYADGTSIYAAASPSQEAVYKVWVDIRIDSE